jgi:CHASE3 domain sensor protein
MTDQTPQRDQPPRDEVRPVMGDHPELETDEEVRTQPVQADDNAMARLLIPGAIVLVIVLIVIAFLIFG